MLRGRTVVRCFAVVCVSALTACSALVDFKGLAGSAADGAAGNGDGALFADGESNSLDGASNDDGGTPDTDGAEPPGEGGPITCPTALHGPALVPVDTYCIDQTEVTNAQYAAFQQASIDPTTQPASCSWNSSFAPSCGNLGGSDLPVACVDWCDAYMFCKWAGKRLCGRIGGGALQKTSADDPSLSQWYRACSKAGTRAYPYGNAFKGGACYDLAVSKGMPTTVGSSMGCVGGYPGIADMNGNVNEWEDACAGNSGMSDMCNIRGGAFDDDMANGIEGCVLASSGQIARNGGDNTIGFRCCAP